MAKIFFNYSEFHFLNGTDKYSVRYIAPTNPKRFESNTHSVIVAKNGKAIYRQSRNEFSNKTNAKKLLQDILNRI